MALDHVSETGATLTSTPEPTAAAPFRAAFGCAFETLTVPIDRPTLLFDLAKCVIANDPGQSFEFA
jgi:hypothetical protein